LTPPSSATSFRDLPDDEQIGGYPNAEQLSEAEFDPATLDCEGRCVLLEFPAFVLIGTYCPAERDETRTHFRTSFLRVLDSRIRNLVKMGKSVVWTGDFNISREEIDTAAAEETMRKNGVDAAEWISTPARRMFNQLLVGGKVHGERDEDKETPILWDICRSFHEGRKGMYTCWETKVNARPGNYGARIDYVVCSHDMKDWFSDSNIQEGLMGSDHCPVYAVMKDTVVVDGEEKHTLDMMNPPGMFVNGERKQQWTNKCMLPMSGKLIQEFDKRQNIRDMFKRTPSLTQSKSNTPTGNTNGADTQFPPPITTPSDSTPPQEIASTPSIPTSAKPSPPKPANVKRMARANDTPPPAKKIKAAPQVTSNLVKGQKSLKGFFTSKILAAEPAKSAEPTIVDENEEEIAEVFAAATPAVTVVSSSKTTPALEVDAATFASKQSWGKLFSRPVAPKCEHNEPCKTMLTKKPGVNCGRSFWMCARPLGPSGKQEKGTQWRCNAFIWSSDWDAHAQPEPG
jgi:AP endonuclease 2